VKRKFKFATAAVMAFICTKGEYSIACTPEKSLKVVAEVEGGEKYYGCVFMRMEWKLVKAKGRTRRIKKIPMILKKVQGELDSKCVS